MKVSVDPQRCQGHCRCIAVAEDLFEADELGYAHAKGDGTVAPDQVERARLAVSNCPEYAVVLDD